MEKKLPPLKPKEEVIDVDDILPRSPKLTRATTEQEVKHEKIKFDLLPAKGPNLAKTVSEGAQLTKEQEAWKVKAWTTLRERVATGEQKFTEETLDRLLKDHDAPVPSAGPELVDKNVLHFGGNEADFPTEKKESESKNALSTCEICMDDAPCAAPCTFAGTKDCSGTVCVPCLQQYLHTKIEASRFSAALIPCPVCRRRLPTHRWMPYATPKDVDVYLSSAAGVLTDRCQNCHTPHSYLVRDNLVSRGALRQSLADSLFGALLEDHKIALMKAWTRFENGTIDAQKLLAVIIQLSPYFGPRPIARDPPVVVVDPNVPEAPPCDFSGAPEAPPFDLGSIEGSSSRGGFKKLSNVPDPSNPLKPPPALEGLFHIYTKDKADTKGIINSMQGPQGSKILRLVFDLERRIALQLAFLRKFPFISDQGCECKAPTCFKCKRKGHHIGKTCAEIQNAELLCEVQYCPQCKIATIKTEGCNAIICVCGAYWQWNPSQGSATEAPQVASSYGEYGGWGYVPCWGAKTWCFLPGGRRRQVQHISVGDEVLTAQGTFRAVSRIWATDLRSHRPAPGEQTNKWVVNFRGMWITSHHPVLVGNDWVNPADLSQCFPAWELADEIGAMYNFELEGHNDTIALCGEDGRDRPIISCTLGKYLGPRFGYTVYTRRSTRCAKDCSQCDVVYTPGIDFGRMPGDIRWRHFPEFTSLEWQGRLEWGGDEGCERRLKQYLQENPNMIVETAETEEQEKDRVVVSHLLPTSPSPAGGSTGVIVGNFSARTTATASLFHAAQQECDHLVIIVKDSPGQEERGEVIAQRLAALCPSAEVICVLDDISDESSWTRRISLVLGKQPDMVFTGESDKLQWMGCERRNVPGWLPEQTNCLPPRLD